MILSSNNLFSQITGHVLGVLFTIALVMVLLENIFPEWFRKHIKRK